MAALHWRGHDIQVAVMPYRLFMLQRVQDAAARLEAEASQQWHALLARTGLAPLMDLRCRRRVRRQGHFEVWGPGASALGSPCD